MFERLVRDPVHHAMPDLAGQRARVAEITVELRDRVPIRVVRRVYFVLAFDDHGRCDVDRLRKQQWAVAALVLDPVLAPPKDADGIRDATDRFIAQGGRWHPTVDQARLIDCAALGITAQRQRGIQGDETDPGLPCANALQLKCTCTAPESSPMTALAAATVRHLPPQPAASLVEWAGAINGVAARAGSARKESSPGRRGGAKPTHAGRLLLTSGERVAGASQRRNSGGEAFGYRMAPEVAEHLVADGLDPDFLGDIAAFSGLDSRDVLDFVGIDRTTVSRRKASGSVLPQDAAVKALQITDLLTQATEVFGSPSQASTWLTRSHPSLDGETPLKRARTPWGMSKVQSVLVALRYGAAA